MRFPFRPVVVFVLITACSGCLYAQKPGKKHAADPSSGKKLATVDGAAITETQARVEGASSLQDLELQVLKEKAAAAQKEQEILEGAVERLIEEKLLQAEAAKEGISKEELLTREVEKKVDEPTAEEMDAFYDENKQRIPRPKEEALPQISRYLKRVQEKNLKEAFLARLEKEHNVVRLLEPLRFNVSASGRPSIGSASAPVILVEFSDFQCPYCKRFSSTIKEVLKQYRNQVQLVFRQFPLTNIHPNAQRAAEASLCANVQGRFWEMHDLLFADQANLKDEDLKNRASKLGLDIAAFDACMDSERYSAQIEEDMRAAAAAGVDGTPALFINGRFLYGSRPFEDVAEIINQELKGKKK
jgi:predicted DsbA family dithiol-disulfide isomerase